jgi:hypothetical protein
VVISYLSYQMKRELYYVSSAAARRSDTSAWRRTSKIVDLFRTKSQEKKFVRDLGVYKKTRVTAIKRSKKEREKKKKLCTRYVFDILWRIVYLLYSPTDFVESSRAIRSGKKKNRFRTIDAAIWKFTHIHHWNKKIWGKQNCDRFGCMRIDCALKTKPNYPHPCGLSNSRL